MPDHGFDDWMDAQLRSVPLPPSLLRRLAESGPGRSLDDAQIDAALRDVPVPARLEARLRRIARPRRQPVWRQLAWAASLFVTVGLGALGYLLLITGTLGPEPAQIAQDEQMGEVPPAVRRAPVNPPADRLAGTRGAPRTVEPAKVSIPAAAELPLPTWDEFTTFAGTVRQAVETKAREQSALGAGGAFDRLPDLDLFEQPAARGMTPPLVTGYDVLFELKNGEHPVVSPTANKALASTMMPFTFSTASYDAALARARRGRTLAADDIRPEDFLAAQAHLLPAPPPGGLALHLAGSSSPFGGKAPHLLQLAVQAASYNPLAHYPSHLVVAIDMSGDMRTGTRLTAVRHALARLARQMRHEDRVTLVRFADEPKTLLTEAAGRQLEDFAWADALAAPTGKADLAQAVASACDLARASFELERRQVVVLTGQRDDLDDATFTGLAEQLRPISEARIPWRIVRLAGSEESPRWADLAKTASGTVATARSSADIYDALLESLLSRSTVVANEASVKLTFNPRVVSGYRLIGHAMTSLDNPSADPVVLDFRADQSALALYEIWLRPGTTEPPLYVDLNWQDPFSDKVGQYARPITQKELSGSFSQAPAWMQAGVIAAKTAEALRGSSYVDTPRPFEQLRDLARGVEPSVARQPQFQALSGLLENAAR